MTSIAARALCAMLCAMLGTIGTAGLVALVDPAPAGVAGRPAPTAIAEAAPLATAHRD